jgi:hypothetical protein
MSSTQPTGADRRPPRSHLLVLNRSFRRTLEAENKGPRTMQAYTDAVRLLATYCQAHSQPLLVNQLQREHIQPFHRRPAGPLEAGHRPRPLPGLARLLQVGSGRGRPGDQPHGRHATAPAPRSTHRRRPARAPRPASQDLRSVLAPAMPACLRRPARDPSRRNAPSRVPTCQRSGARRL